MTNNFEPHWKDCLRAFLHDPFDKALDVKGHEKRACRYQSAALTIPEDEARSKYQKQGDWLGSAIDRLPLPKGTIWQDGKPLLDSEQPFNRLSREVLTRCNPCSGETITNSTVAYRASKDCTNETVDERVDIIRGLATANNDMRLRSYAMWRLLPEKLPHIATLPADTRLSDHSIVDHLDACTASTAALRGDKGASLLTFSLAPVQQFIVQGRSLRDLWSGSYFISWLTFHAMIPILSELGPWSVVSPGLRKNALCDWWFSEEGVCNSDGEPIAYDKKNLRWAGIPNCFTALVPTEKADELKKKCIQSCQDEWENISDSVFEELHAKWSALGLHWSEGWKEQCDSVWDIRCVYAHFANAQTSEKIKESAENITALYKDLMGDLPKSVKDAAEIANALKKKDWLPGYSTPESQGMWQIGNEITQRLMEADKRARLVPSHAPVDDTREKCALFAGFAVMGPNGDSRKNKEWWNKAVQNLPHIAGVVRDNERLSAPGLIKRFAFGSYFKDIIGSDSFPDTREVSFSGWVHELKQEVPNLWEKWETIVFNSNDDVSDELLQKWTAYELLDPGSINAINWYHGAADNNKLEKERLNIQCKRNQLLKEAKSYGLPEPKPYYAIICADGDNMGEYLRGERGPTFYQSYHDSMTCALKESCSVSDKILNGIRPQGMASQLAFSAALNDFTTSAAKTVAEHNGTCIYAGGDDVLAVIPVQDCLKAAAELAETFSRTLEGGSISAGIAVVHAQEDLRVGIKAARIAESEAKTEGRDGLCLRIVRRNGDTTSAYCPWLFSYDNSGSVGGVKKQTRNLASDWNSIAQALTGQSDRWIHHLIAEREVLRAMPLDVVWARIKYLLLHGEEGKKRELYFKQYGNDKSLTFTMLLDCLQEIWQDASTGLKSREGYTRRESEIKDEGTKWLIDQFITWCEHVAWLSSFQKNVKTNPMLETIEETY